MGAQTAKATPRDAVVVHRVRAQALPELLVAALAGEVEVQVSPSVGRKLYGSRRVKRRAAGVRDLEQVVEGARSRR